MRENDVRQAEHDGRPGSRGGPPARGARRWEKTTCVRPSTTAAPAAATAPPRGASGGSHSTYCAENPLSNASKPVTAAAHAVRKASRPCAYRHATKSTAATTSTALI